MDNHIDLQSKTNRELETLIENYVEAGLEDKAQRLIAERIGRGGRVSAYKEMLKWNDKAIRRALQPFEDLARNVIDNGREYYAEAGGRVFTESYFKDQYTGIKRKWINATFGCRIKSAGYEPEFVLIIYSGGERGETIFAHDQLGTSAISRWAGLVDQALDPLGSPFIGADLVRHIAERLEPYIDGRTYSWDLNEAELVSFGLDFAFGTTRTAAQRTHALRASIADWWVTAPSAEKRRLIEWIIRDWGGISNNSKKTLTRIAELADAEHPETDFAGIASLSKVLSFVRPNQFAVYDSRVAVALNSLQMTSGLPALSCVAFPYPPGRNTKLFGSAGAEGFVDRHTAKSLSDAGYLKIAQNLTYNYYIELVRKVAERLGYSISQVEMALFAEALNFASEVDDNR